MNSSPLKRVLVTGAQGVVGSSVVKRFLEAGCEVTGTYFPEFIENPDLSGQKIKWVQVNLADPKRVKKCFEGQTFDGWIHCAGGFRYAPSDQLKDEDFEFLMGVNLNSAFYLVRELLPQMKKQNFGRIVFISSKATLAPVGGLGAYAASKAGLNALTLALADETKSFNINVNAVLPTTVDTPANRKDMPSANFSSWVLPSQLAEVIYTLTNSVGTPVHGALIPVSGRL